jgi:hypothetical protein
MMIPNIEVLFSLRLRSPLLTVQGADCHRLWNPTCQQQRRYHVVVVVVAAAASASLLLRHDVYRRSVREKTTEKKKTTKKEWICTVFDTLGCLFRGAHWRFCPFSMVHPDLDEAIGYRSCYFPIHSQQICCPTLALVIYDVVVCVERSCRQC